MEIKLGNVAVKFAESNGEYSTDWMQPAEAKRLVASLEAEGYEASEAYSSDERLSCVYVTPRAEVV